MRIKSKFQEQELLTPQKAEISVRKHRRAVGCFLTVVILLGCGLSLAQTPVGSVTELVGIGKLSRGNHELDVVIRMAVMLRDKLQTMAKSHLTVTLNGGSKLMLAELSTMIIDEDVSNSGPADASISLLLGHLRARVNLGVAPASKFEVRTPNAVIGARGTQFETAYIEGKPCPGFPTCLRYTEVGVYEGVVEVRNPTNPKAPSVRVSQGYETTVPCDLPPTSAAPLEMSELGAPGYR
jgi:FecR protein